MVARLNDRNRIAKFIKKLASDFPEKLESSLDKWRGLRNCKKKKGKEFLRCDGYEDEYNK